MKIRKHADEHLMRRFCRVCWHCAQAHVRNLSGKFMGELAQCNYSRCKCVGYVPNGWVAPPAIPGYTPDVSSIKKSASVFQSEAR